VCTFLVLNSMYNAADMGLFMVNHGNALYGAAMLAGLLTGISFVYLQKYAIMIGTAVLGATLAVSSLFQGIIGVGIIVDGSDIDIVQQVLTIALAVSNVP
jgi:hypothetical protein